MNARDQLQAALTPIVMVPPSGLLSADDRPDAHRYLTGSDGLYVEINRPWLHAIQRIASSAVPLPFGSISETIKLKCGPVPRELFAEFREVAENAFPKETAGIIVWSADTGRFRLIITATESSASTVEYEIPRLPRDEYRVIDIHSHGRFAAGFSQVDDLDDRYDVKLAVVLGRLDQPRLDVRARMCLMGIYIGMDKILPEDYFQ